jgi:hypothetical protein
MQVAGQTSVDMVEAPLFVLCGARSGSTLLRFILDAHPDLACPPETNLPALCAHLATVWSLIEGAPLSHERGEEPPAIPDAAAKGIRQTVDLMTGSYLARRGGRRYCDKSLSTAPFTDLLLRVYPEAKFLCLYRHPMDMIASGLEACPFGLRGYGFDPYIAASPGNTVLALARYWIENTAAILAAADRFPESCYRVRYEDLVADPESVVAGIFEFLGVAGLPGVAARCFTAERERSGPSDYKIWHTSGVSSQSVGRGWAIPVTQVPDPVIEQVNELAGRLSYVKVDGQWGTSAVPGELRADAAGEGATTTEPGTGSPDAAEPLAALLGQRLVSGCARLDGDLIRRWGPCASMSFGIVVTGSAGIRSGARWRIDPAARTVEAVPCDDDSTEWDVLGPAGAWRTVLDGTINLGVALRRQDLRYCEMGDDGSPFVADSRVDLLADLLGLANWPATAQLARR